jgi:hypothetical protein
MRFARWPTSSRPPAFFAFNQTNRSE